MGLLRLGVLATSGKQDERRLPIHPLLVERIDADLRERIVLERGYGERFGVSDSDLEPLVHRIGSREDVLATSDVVLLPKRQPSDLAEKSVV